MLAGNLSQLSGPVQEPALKLTEAGPVALIHGCSLNRWNAGLGCEGSDQRLSPFGEPLGEHRTNPRYLLGSEFLDVQRRFNAEGAQAQDSVGRHCLDSGCADQMTVQVPLQLDLRGSIGQVGEITRVGFVRFLISPLVRLKVLEDGLESDFRRPKYL